MLSDRALLRLEQGGTLDGEIAPAALYQSLEETWAARRARVGTVAQSAAADMPADVAAIVSRSASLDATIVDLAQERALSNVDLQVLYLPGLDIAQHALLTGTTATAPSAVAARVQAIERYYVFLDGLLDALPRTDRTVMLVLQPGRVTTPGSGLLALAGVPARRGATVSTTAESVAATALYLLGVPVAKDLAQPVAEPLLAPAFTAAHPTRFIDTYGARHLAPRRTSGQPLDQEMIERMRSLGYVK